MCGNQRALEGEFWGLLTQETRSEKVVEPRLIKCSDIVFDGFFVQNDDISWGEATLKQLLHVMRLLHNHTKTSQVRHSLESSNRRRAITRGFQSGSTDAHVLEAYNRCMHLVVHPEPMTSSVSSVAESSAVAQVATLPQTRPWTLPRPATSVNVARCSDDNDDEYDDGDACVFFGVA